MVYIVKKRVTGTIESWQYLDGSNRWSSDVNKARVFSNKGHAKSSLKSHFWGHGADRRASYRSAVQLGEAVIIQPCTLSQRGAGEEWVAE